MNSEHPESLGRSASIHLDDDTLERFACGGLDATARAQVRAHADRCASCAALLEGLTLLQHGAERFDPEAPRLRPGRGRTWVPIAVAAALTIAVFTPVVWRWTQSTAPPQTRDAAAGASPSVMSPSGTLHDAPLRFEWRTYDGARAYEVLLFREDGTLIWQQRTQNTHVDRPADLDIGPGRYYWRLRVLLNEGEPAESPLTRFEVTIR